MILISPDSVRTKAQALFVHQRWPASVYVLPKVTRGHFQGFSAISMKEDGQLGLNVVMPTAGFRVDQKDCFIQILRGAHSSRFLPMNTPPSSGWGRILRQVPQIG